MQQMVLPLCSDVRNTLASGDMPMTNGLQPSEDRILASIDANISEGDPIRYDDPQLSKVVPEIERSTLLYQFESIWENYQGQGVKVAVLDTGLDVQHPAFPTAII